MQWKAASKRKQQRERKKRDFGKDGRGGQEKTNTKEGVKAMQNVRTKVLLLCVTRVVPEAITAQKNWLLPVYLGLVNIWSSFVCAAGFSGSFCNLKDFTLWLIIWLRECCCFYCRAVYNPTRCGKMFIKCEPVRRRNDVTWYLSTEHVHRI